MKPARFGASGIALGFLILVRAPADAGEQQWSKLPTAPGEQWKAVWKGRGTYVRALEFIDEETGFLGNVGPSYFPDVTDKRPLYMTGDGGEHWSPIAQTA